MTPDEVRLLDNKYAILFIRGERPIIDLKYNILTHLNISLTPDGSGNNYIYGKTDNEIASVNLNFNDISKQSNEEEYENDEYDIVSSENIDDYFRKKEKNEKNQ